MNGETPVLPESRRGSSSVGFFLFSLVGASGVLVQFASLWLTHEWLDFNFTNSQIVATLVAMTSNFILNNELTYGERSLRGRRWWSGLLSFYAVCSIGAIANIAVAVWVYQIYQNLWIASLVGVAVSVAFNYTLTRLFTWR